MPSTTAAASMKPAPAAQAVAVNDGAAKSFDPGDVLPWLPCTLALEAEVVGFTVDSLLRLTDGTLITTSSHQSSDIALRVNGILMAWTEFEVVGERLAARITDLV